MKGQFSIKTKAFTPLSEIEVNQIRDSQEHLTDLDLSHKLIAKHSDSHLSLPITLLKLNLESNCLRQKHMDVIIHLTNLTSLNFSNNPIGTSGLKMLINMRKLTQLRLSNTKLDGESIKVITFAFIILRQLDLGFNNLGPEAPYCDLTKLQHLEELDLCQNGLTDNGLTQLKLLTQSKPLKSLNLRSNHISIRSIPVLSCLTGLQNLSLGYNHLQQNCLVPAISALQNLRSLNLSYNLAGNAVMIAISKYCLLIEKLDLRCNKCSFEGAEQLIKNLQGMTYLCLNQNQIGFPDSNGRVPAFVELIKGSSLVVLQMTNNKLQKEERLQLIRLLSVTKVTFKAPF